MPVRLVATVAAILAALTLSSSAQSTGAPGAARGESDLDAFMRQVLTRRDDNWKKLQQYTLDEDETFQLSALNGRKLYGFKREYTWYPSDTGVFIRSPISADGVKLSEAERRQAEAEWIRDEQRRERDRQKQDEDRARGADGQDADADSRPDDDAADGGQAGVDTDAAPGLDDLVKPGNEPRFVSSAYFMKFKFDEGTYAFAGREPLLGREVLKIEYYPRHFFSNRQKRATKPAADGTATRNDTGDKIEQKMDKVSMITLWIEPADHQILQYEFTNIDFDFMPGRQLVQLDDLRAAMRMREAFPGVWLPDTITMAFGVTSALGDVAGRYEVKYHDYKLAEVKARVR